MTLPQDDSLAETSSKSISTCVSLLTRMIHTTPASVQLTDIITPNEVKPVNVSLAVDPAGLVQITWTSRTGATSTAFITNAIAVQTGNSSMFGTAFYHLFNTSIDPAYGISAFKITILKGRSTQIFSNDGVGYPIEDGVVFLPHDTIVGSDGTLSVHAAVLTAVGAQNVTAFISVPSTQLGTDTINDICA
ncbi:hypothetical protein C8J57DRAFT_1650734 [Mycena rebaudengoi]|nr:hypothetical protein C8J57DRAFT_1650734 [Mycena rebaudengoi]